MLYNATILAINSPAASTPGGTAAYTAGAACSVRCWASAARQSGKYSPAVLAEEVAIVLSVLDRDLKAALARAGYAAGFALAREQQIVLKADDEAISQTYRVHKVQFAPKGSQSLANVELIED